MPKTYAIILAAGSGSRTKEFTPKAFLKINELFIIEYSILQLSNNYMIDHVILVVPKAYQAFTEELVQIKKYEKVINVLSGGANRFKSSGIGLAVISEPNDRVLIHDAARPFITKDIIDNCLNALNNSDAVNILTPISDTLVELKGNEIIGKVDREKLRRSQTPQGFLVSAIKKAHELAEENKFEDITDDFNLVLKFGTGSTSWVDGSRYNIKITYAEDLIYAQRFLV
jgi:2-C-methyl-D-erythritol 4-phosphate cytidylyltransferase